MIIIGQKNRINVFCKEKVISYINIDFVTVAIAQLDRATAS